MFTGEIIKNLVNLAIHKVLVKSWKRDLNPRPTDYESVALPTALFQLMKNTSCIIYE